MDVIDGAREDPPQRRAEPRDGGLLSFLEAGGEMGARIRVHDWSACALGNPETWPQSLRTLVGVMLGSRQPMFVAWGPQRILLYNDGYAPILGGKHPKALGQRFLDVWSEVSDDLQPLLDKVDAGESVNMDDIALTLERHGHPEEAHFAFSYTPVRDEYGRVAGFFCPCTETTAQVLAERRNVAERERLEQLFQQAPGFMAMLRGPDHVFELVNPAYMQLIGHREVIGMPAREALPEIAGQGFFGLLDNVYAGGQAFRGNAMRVGLQRTPGAPVEERFVDLVYQPVTDSENRVTGIFAEGSDVTERVQAEAALRDSETRLRDITDAVPLLISYVDRDQRFQFVNRPYEQWFGRPLQETLGRRVCEVMAPPAYEARRPFIERALAGETVQYEVDMPRLDGVVHTEVTHIPHRSAGGDILGFYSVVQDITPRKRIEAALRELNDTLERRVEERTAERDRIWHMSHDLFAIMGFDGYLKAVNPAWEQTLGFDAPSLLSRDFSQQVHPDDHAAVGALVERLRAGETVVGFEDRLRHADGSWRWISWTLVPAEDVFYAVGRDVTAEKERVEELHRAQDALRQAQKMEAVGQLTGGIAHDFNNLLTGIIGSLDMLQRRISAGRTNETERFVSAAVTSANRAAALTHRLLAFSRRQPLDPKPVNANRLVTSMEELLRRTLGESIELEMVAAGGLWQTKCDPHQLESALLNLAINARDAMPDGGKLTIETCNAHLDNVYVAKTRDVRPGQYVCICVSDTGAGMSKDTIEKAFEPFFTTKPIGQGTGLGLSMVYGFARQSDGYAKIYSEPGQGTTVKLYLPRFYGEGEREEDALLTSDEAMHAEHGEVVVVVEDETAVRDVVVEVLKDLGYQAFEASDGPSGLKLLERLERVDLLVTDVGLPGLNGRQLADAAREKRPELKILFMTGYAENAAINGGFLEPGMEMITKPFPVDALIQRIRSMTESSRSLA